MRPISLLSLAILASAGAAPFPHIRYTDFSVPRTVIAGSRTFISTAPQYAFNFTVDHTTNIYTVTGGTYTPNNGDVVNTAETTGTLPAGLYGTVDFSTPIWDICDAGVGGAGTFHLKQDPMNFSTVGPCTGALQTVSDNGSGTHTLSLYQNATAYLDADPTGWPVGTTFAYMAPLTTSECNHTAPTSNGKPYSPPGPIENALCIVATVPSGATPGTVTTHYTFCQTDMSVNCTTYDWVIEVVAPPSVAYTPPGSFSSLTSKAYWEGVMIARPCPNTACGSGGGPASDFSGPANYCDPLAAPMPVNSLGAATSATVSFYGWNLLFDNMTIYTGNPVYRSGCFQTGMGHVGTMDLQSVRYYVTAGGGNMIGYAHFTEELYRACRVFSDPSYCTAGNLMQNNYIPLYGPKLGYSYLRENSYGLDDAVALSKYGSISTAHWADVRDGLYGLVLRATESDGSGVRYNQQQFIDGLAMHALIADWQLSGDNRAPFAIKRVLDRIWADYDMVNHAYMNIEGPDNSPWCSNAALWFYTDVTGNCGVNALTYQALQSMLLEGFWWYYAYTGDTTYRDRGDDLFAHIFDNAFLTGKDDSQVYYGTFNAVAWRTGTQTAMQWFGDSVVPLGSATTVSGGVSIKGLPTVH